MSRVKIFKFGWRSRRYQYVSTTIKAFSGALSTFHGILCPYLETQWKRRPVEWGYYLFLIRNAFIKMLIITIQTCKFQNSCSRNSSCLKYNYTLFIYICTRLYWYIINVFDNFPVLTLYYVYIILHSKCGIFTRWVYILNIN